MNKKSRRTFSTEFIFESAQLVVEQQYSIREATTAVGVGHSAMDKWVRQLRDERGSVTPSQTSMTSEHRRIKEHNQILQKATALLISGSLNNGRLLASFMRAIDPCYRFPFIAKYDSQ
jgi:transposase